MAKPHSIGWSVDRDGRGYSVATYYNDGDQDLYQNGNHPDVSEVWIPADDPRALSAETLAEQAQQTALEMAQEFGLGPDAVFHDIDGQCD